MATYESLDLIVDADRQIISELETENERLKLIVRERTHRDKGCLCERCVETEYDIARVMWQLRAEIERLQWENEKLRKEADA